MTSTTTVTGSRPDRSIVEEIELAHLAGVVDGRGLITVKVVKNSDYRINYRLIPMFRYNLITEEEPMLGKLVGYSEDEGVRFSISDTENEFEFKIKRIDGIERFLEPLMPYLLSQYPNASLMLEQIIPDLRNDKDKTKEGFYEMMADVDKIRENRMYRNRETKYDQEFFADLWSLPE